MGASLVQIGRLFDWIIWYGLWLRIKGKTSALDIHCFADV